MLEVFIITFRDAIIVYLDEFKQNQNQSFLFLTTCSEDI
jgi:hypothetical protein